MKYTLPLAIGAIGLLLGSCASERTTFVKGNAIEWQAKNAPAVQESSPMIETAQSVSFEETTNTAEVFNTPAEQASEELTASVGTAAPIEVRRARTYSTSTTMTTEAPVEVAATSTVLSEAAPKAAVIAPAAPGGGGKSQVLAAVLAFFLGGIGIHRFYLGYTWQGIVQIFTLGGLGIWALIDFIRICIGDLEPKDGSYS